MNWFKMLWSLTFRTRAYHEIMILYWFEIVKDCQRKTGALRGFGDYATQESHAKRKMAHHLANLKHHHPWRLFPWKPYETKAGSHD